MSSTALKILAFITLLLAIGLGFMAYKMSQSITAPAATVVETKEEKKLAYTMAVVTIQPVKAYQTVKPEDVELVPVSVLPPQYFETKEEVVGKRPLIDVDTGTTLTTRLFQDSNVLAKSIPEEHRAMSLEIDDVVAVGGFVQPGDRVDALLYVRAVGKEVNDSQARMLLEAVKVLAYEEQILPELEQAEDKKSSQTNNKRQRRKRTVVLAVPEKDTVRVMLGASIGEIRLALHGKKQEENDEAIPMADAANGEQVKPAQDEKKTPIITLRELTEIKKRKQTKQSRYVARPIVVYRGNEKETVRR